MNMNEPKLRFKADDGSRFPDWEKKPFGDVVSEFKVKTKVEDEDTLLSCAINGVFLNSELFGHQRGQSNVGYLKIKKGTLILSAQNLHLGNANVNMRFEHGMISPAYKTYNIIGCCVEYMNQWVKRDITKRFFYNATTVGASGCRRNVDWEMLYSQLFAVPSLPEQQKIAEFLSTIDTVIEKQKETVSAWEERKKGVMQKLFSQEVRFKADDGSDFPDWEEKKIGELGTFIKGAALSKADISESGSPLILYGELYTTYKEVAYNIQRKTQNVVDKKYYSCVGDVIIPTSGESAEEISTATCVMVPDVLLGGDLNIFRSDIVDGRVMSYILNHQVKWKIATIAQGKSVVHIQAKQLANICVKYPFSKAEQQKIADCLSSLDGVIEKQKATLAAWEELKKGLLQQMFA